MSKPVNIKGYEVNCPCGEITKLQEQCTGCGAMIFFLPSPMVSIRLDTEKLEKWMSEDQRLDPMQRTVFIIDAYEQIKHNMDEILRGEQDAFLYSDAIEVKRI